MSANGEIQVNTLGRSVQMRRYEVNSRVNLVKNDDPACAEPVTRTDAAEM